MTTKQTIKIAKRVCDNCSFDKLYVNNITETCTPLTDCTDYYAQRQNLLISPMSKNDMCGKDKDSCTYAINKKTYSPLKVNLKIFHQPVNKNFNGENIACNDRVDATLFDSHEDISSVNMKRQQQSAACSVQATRIRHEPYAISLLKPEDSLYSANLTHVTFKVIRQPLICKSSQSDILSSKSHSTTCAINVDNNRGLINNEMSSKSRSNGSYENSLNSPLQNTRCTSEGNVSRYQQYINCPSWFQVSEVNRLTQNISKSKAMHLSSYAVHDEKQSNSQIIVADENEQMNKTCLNENTVNVISYQNSTTNVYANEQEKNDDQQKYNECNYNEHWSQVNNNNSCFTSQSHLYNSKSNYCQHHQLQSKHTNCETTLARNTLHSYHSQRYKADISGNKYKYYNDAAKQSNNQHFTEDQPCVIEPITLPPSRYQIQQQLQLATRTTPMPSATNEKTICYKEDKTSERFTNKGTDTNKCCECTDESNCLNINQFNPRQTSDITYRVCVDDAPSRGISHEYDYPLNGHQCMNTQCEYSCRNNNQCNDSKYNNNNNNNNFSRPHRYYCNQQHHELLQQQQQHHRCSNITSNSFNSSGDHDQLAPTCTSRLPQQLSAPTSVATAATSSSSSSSSLSPQTSPQQITDYSPFSPIQHASAKITDLFAATTSGLSSVSMHVSDSHSMSKSNSNNITTNTNTNTNNSSSNGNNANQKTHTPNANGVKCVTTPIKNLSKIYVSGRPLPVRRSTPSRRQVVEVKVNLRHCQDDFLITDLHAMFGPHIKLTELIGRYVLVEGDRGVDMGQITAVLKTNVVAHSDVNPLSHYELNYMGAQAGSFHVSSIDLSHAHVPLDDSDASNVYVTHHVNGISDDNGEDNNIYYNNGSNNNNNSSSIINNSISCSNSLKLSTHRNKTGEMYQPGMVSKANDEVELTNEQNDSVYFNEENEQQEQDIYPSLDHLPVPTAQQILQEQFMPRVLREATCHDQEEMMTLTQDEVEARNYCEQCLQRIHLPVPINIEDVLFQFDRKKLIVRYTSNAYVDFNVLTRTLHNRYKCRI